MTNHSLLSYALGLATLVLIPLMLRQVARDFYDLATKGNA